ncbi:MAG: porin family protein [Bacteroidota bacterium]|nr:porin family protein [Bacteroidota bacterium]
MDSIRLNLLSICLMMFLSTSLLWAQNNSQSPTFGIKGGFLLSTISGDEAIDQYAKKIGPQIGFTAAYYPHVNWSARAELNYELKGGKFDMHDMKMSLHYVTLPLYAKFTFNEDPKIYFYAGGYGSFLISANTKGKYEKIIEEDYLVQSINEDITLNLNRFDVGILAGCGVQGRFNRYLDIFIDLRYTKGFFNVDNNTAEVRYNFNYEEFFPYEQELDNPANKAFMLTTGFIYFLIPR